MLKTAGRFVSLLCAARVVASTSVIAHYMAQELYSYETDDINSDIDLAMSLGIDAFVFNIAAMDYEKDKMQGVVIPACESKGFKFLYSIDTTYDWTAGDIASLVSATANSSAQYLWNGKPLLSSFSTTRDGYGDDFWASVKSNLQSAGVDVVLAPALTQTTPDELSSDYPSADGFMNWWAWPSDVAANLTTDQDHAYQAVVKQRTGPYIMGVSPWQFKDISGNSWVQQSDYLFKYRWEQAITDVQPDIVEIITWNDYGESHYIVDVNPIVNLGSDAPNYVDGVNHSGWQTMVKYYIGWFKGCLGTSSFKRELPVLRRSRAKTRAAFKPRANFTTITVTETETITVTGGSSSSSASDGTTTVTETETVYVTVGGSSTDSSSSTEASSSGSDSSTSVPVTTDVASTTESPSTTTSSASPSETTSTSTDSCSAPAFASDVLVWYFRIYPKDISCSGGTDPRNKEYPSDSIFAWVGLTSAATVKIDAGNSSGTWDLEAGASIVSVAMPSTDETPYFQIIRDSTVVVSGHATASLKHSDCTWYDMNPRVGLLDSVESTSTSTTTTASS